MEMPQRCGRTDLLSSVCRHKVSRIMVGQKALGRHAFAAYRALIPVVTPIKIIAEGGSILA